MVKQFYDFGPDCFVYNYDRRWKIEKDSFYPSVYGAMLSYPSFLSSLLVATGGFINNSSKPSLLEVSLFLF